MVKRPPSCPMSAVSTVAINSKNASTSPMPNSESNDSGGIRSQMESDKQTKRDLEEILREIGTLIENIEELSRKVEEDNPTVVAEEVRQKADHLETKAEEINTALIKLQSQGVPLENEEKIKEMNRKLERFMDVVGPAKSLAEVRTDLSQEWETKIKDLKKAWALALEEIREDKKYRKTVTDDLKTSWWHVTKIVTASSLGGDDVDGSDDLRLDVVRGATSSGGGEDDAGREGADRGRQGSKGSLSGTRRRRVRETPGPLEAGDRELSSSGPGMTDPESLDDREREVWARLSDGEKEAAAWAFDDLNESEQKELVRKIDQFDRKDLRAGFEAIIERQEEEAISQQESQSQDWDRSQSKSQGRGGRSRR